MDKKQQQKERRDFFGRPTTRLAVWMFGLTILTIIIRAAIQFFALHRFDFFFDGSKYEYSNGTWKAVSSFPPSTWDQVITVFGVLILVFISTAMISINMFPFVKKKGDRYTSYDNLGV